MAARPPTTRHHEMDSLKQQGAVSNNPFFRSLSKGTAASSLKNYLHSPSTEQRVTQTKNPFEKSELNLMNENLYDRNILKSANTSIKNSSVSFPNWYAF